MLSWCAKGERGVTARARCVPPACCYRLARALLACPAARSQCFCCEVSCSYVFFCGRSRFISCAALPCCCRRSRCGCSSHSDPRTRRRCVGAGGSRACSFRRECGSTKLPISTKKACRSANNAKRIYPRVALVFLSFSVGPIVCPILASAGNCEIIAHRADFLFLTIFARCLCWVYF